MLLQNELIHSKSAKIVNCFSDRFYLKAHKRHVQNVVARAVLEESAVPQERLNHFCFRSLPARGPFVLHTTINFPQVMKISRLHHLKKVRAVISENEFCVRRLRSGAW